MRTLALTLLAALTLAFPAFASQRVALPVGSTTTLSLPAPVSKVHVKDPKLVEVTAHGRRVTIVGLEKGSTEATVHTKDGEVTLSIYVAQDKHALPY